MTDPQGASGPAAGMATARSDSEGTVHAEVCGQADTVSGAPVEDDTVFQLCSMSKLVSAVTVLRLLDRAQVPLETGIDGFLRVSITDQGRRAPTLREVLSHHGGIADPEGAFTPGPVPERALSAEEIIAGETDPHPAPVRVSFLPGSTFHYSDGAYCLIERVIELLSGASFLTAVTEEVMAPLGQPALSLGPGLDGSLDTPQGPGTGKSVARGHDAEGAPLPGGHVYYPGAAASGLWGDIGQISSVLADLGQSAAGRSGVLLSPRLMGQMMSDHGSGAGLGVFTLGPSHTFPVLTQGWGIGFQCQARIDPPTGRSAVVLTNSDPGVPQSRSPVGTAMRALTTSGTVE